MPIMLICLTFVYAALAAFVWFWRLKREAADYPLGRELAVLAAALLPHGAALLLPVLSDHVLILGLGYATAVVVWLMLMLYLAGSFFYRLRGLQLLLYPCRPSCCFAPRCFPAIRRPTGWTTGRLCCTSCPRCWRTACSASPR